MTYCSSNYPEVLSFTQLSVNNILKNKNIAPPYFWYLYDQVELFLFLTLFLFNSNIKTLTLQQLQ